MTIQATSIDLGFRERTVDTFARLLESINCENTNVTVAPPFTTWDEVYKFLQIKNHPTLPDSFLEGWFITRELIQDFDIGGNTKYTQQHRYLITALTWRGNYIDSYLYLQDKVDVLTRTLELNKSLGRQFNEVTEIEANFFMGNAVIAQMAGTEALQLYKAEINFSLLEERTEPSGRVES